MYFFFIDLMCMSEYIETHSGGHKYVIKFAKKNLIRHIQINIIINTSRFIVINGTDINNSLGCTANFGPQLYIC